jgi:hypothetical protein
MATTGDLANLSNDVYNLSGGKKKVSATVLRFRHGVPPPLARVFDVSASH